MNKGKRIGFLLRSIHFGSSLKLWTRLADYAAQKSGSFFIFPGGEINKKQANERLRNGIYKLANKENLDGVISWTSSIGSGAKQEEIDNYHENLNSLPFVTIGSKYQNHPDASFDAYTGMKELVRHLINVHGVKKIAFIRGALSHISAEDRYRGYMDAIREAGLDTPENERLISDNVGWSSAEIACAQLYEERGLIPGKDFEALVASSDLMALAAITWFEKRGYNIPGDYIVGGFNDSVESRIFKTPFSTVHMPMEALGVAAYEKLNQVLEGDKNVEDVVLPAYPVIRESCGCGIFHFTETSDIKIHAKTRDQLVDQLTELLRGNEEIKEKMISPLFDNLFENNQPEFFRLLREELITYFQRDGELSNLFKAIKVISNSNLLPEEYVQKIGNAVSMMIPQVANRVSELRLYDYERVSDIVSRFKSDLLSAHNREALLNVLYESLPQIGIRTAMLVLYENEELSRYIGGFNNSGEVTTEDLLFGSKLLVPAKYSRELEYGVYVVQPLFIGEHPLGYIILNYCGCDGNVYEDIRTSVSNALQSIILFEETENAKQRAEQAEFAKTEFFANVGNDLCDPLKNISAKLTQMEENTDKGILDQDILSEQILFLKSQINSQLQKTQTLIDLTRSQVNDLPMDKKLFDIRQVLPGSVVASLNTEIPLIYGDADRLKKSLNTIFDEAQSEMQVNVQKFGLILSLNTEKVDWEKPDLLLSEKIILLQYGEIQRTPHVTNIILPWPNLSGLPPVKQEATVTKIYNLSATESDSALFGIDVDSVNRMENQPENADGTILFWRPDNAPIDEWVKVYGLRHNEKIFRMPLLCYSHELIGHNFVEVLESKVRSQKSSPVLFVNSKNTRFGTWATDSNSISISSMNEFEKILGEITPSLIIFEKITEEDIKKIRQNHKTVLVPILVLPDSVLSDEEVDMLCSHPRIILCNRGAAESEQFNKRIHEILAGDEILPPHTGALVKKAILYLNKNASQQIVRWKLADTVHVSEDYLTRIFHKEIGLSLWEYLNQYRIYLATKMLLETNDTIYEIAEKAGFQDQAYFCRVFKKVYGVPPGKIRTKQ